ncbi:MAG: nucleotide exchange factor GrpE [Gammaproteobacteria bacterium]|nr:nucleotide exchange factor GrpE [Gammaproteobacteria bacterium]
MKKEQETVEQETAAEEATPNQETSSEESVAPAAEASHEELTLLLEDERAKADEHWDQLMRTRADIENLKKRQGRDLENAHKFALERFANELLPVHDSMELGLSAAQDDGADIAKLIEGVELTLKLFSDVMEKFNLVQVNPEGESFDPELHQAMTMVPRDDVPPNTVVTVVQKGYTLNGRLIRPAMVMVSQAS